MKKLRRFTFDEMRQNMVCIEEDAQREYVGGKYYYKSDGTFLYSDGSGNEVMIKDVVGSGGSTPSGSSNDCDTLCSYQKLSQASSSAKQAVINTMARSAGISGGVLVGDLGNKKESAKNSSLFGIKVNSNSYVMDRGNFNELMCVLVHEKSHSQSAYPGTAQSEYDALIAEQNSAYFSGTSNEYKASFQEELNRVEKQLGLK